MAENRKEIKNTRINYKNSSDRRSKYSMKVIHESFMELLTEKEFASITVTDICRKADINRGTFYRYYQDVSDLYDKLEDEFVDSLRVPLENYTLQTDDDLRNILKDVLDILQENEGLITLIHDQDLTKTVVHKLFSRMDEPIELMVKSRHPEASNEEISFVLDFIIGGSALLITHWLEDPQGYSAESITELIIKII